MIGLAAAGSGAISALKSRAFPWIALVVVLAVAIWNRDQLRDEIATWKTNYETAAKTNAANVREIERYQADIGRQRAALAEIAAKQTARLSPTVAKEIADAPDPVDRMLDHLDRLQR